MSYQEAFKLVAVPVLGTLTINKQSQEQVELMGFMNLCHRKCLLNKVQKFNPNQNKHSTISVQMVYFLILDQVGVVHDNRTLKLHILNVQMGGIQLQESTGAFTSVQVVNFQILDPVVAIINPKHQ